MRYIRPAEGHGKQLCLEWLRASLKEHEQNQSPDVFIINNIINIVEGTNDASVRVGIFIREASRISATARDLFNQPHWQEGGKLRDALVKFCNDSIPETTKPEAAEELDI